MLENRPPSPAQTEKNKLMRFQCENEVKTYKPVNAGRNENIKEMLKKTSKHCSKL
jgi:hypothetical protein